MVDNVCGGSENQRILIETVQRENAKFGECQAMAEVTETVSTHTCHGRCHRQIVNTHTAND